MATISADGTALLSATYLGGSYVDIGGYDTADVVLDAFGNAFVHGWTSSSDFPTTSDAFDANFTSNGESFISKISPDASTLLYSTYFRWHIDTMGIDPNGTLRLAGDTATTDFPTTPGAYDPTFNGVLDVFVASFSAGLGVPSLLPVTTGTDLAPSTGLPVAILVDNITRDEWGLSWVKLPAGEHRVSFANLSGYDAPPDVSLTTFPGKVTEITGTYRQHGSLRVQTDPAVPSTIFVNGIPRDDWGLWVDLPPGTYVVSFGPVQGFRVPKAQTVTVVAGQLTSIVGTFRADQNALGPDPSTYGLLRATTGRSDGGVGVPSTVFVDGVARDVWGLAWVKLPPGLYTISFAGVPGLATPAPQTVHVLAMQTTMATGVFGVLGYLRVTTDPALPSTISVNGIPRDDWGMWLSLPAGTYSVAFGDVPGFSTPAAKTVTVVAGQLTSVVGSFTAKSTAPAAINPAASDCISADPSLAFHRLPVRLLANLARHENPELGSREERPTGTTSAESKGAYGSDAGGGNEPGKVPGG